MNVGNNGNGYSGNEECITICVRQQGEDDMYLKTKQSIKFERIFKVYAKLKGVRTNELRFIFDGERIEPTSTPQEMDMYDLDAVDAFRENDGGTNILINDLAGWCPSRRRHSTVRSQCDPPNSS